MNVGKRAGVVAALVICLLILAACGLRPRPEGLPDPPGDTDGLAPRGQIADRLPLQPITFSIDTDGTITVVANAGLVTLLGDVTVDGNNVTNAAGTPLQLEPADVTQLIICQQVSTGQDCKAYQIVTGRPIRIEMNGFIVPQRNRPIIEAAPGSTINVIDNGPPPATLDARGPARIDVKEFDFQEAGEETAVDLERAPPGTTVDLSYDHISGELKPINGAKVSLYAKSGWGLWSEPEKRSDYPGEQECRERPAEVWRDAFSEDDLKAEHSIFCIRTAEGNAGFLFIKPDNDLKPVGYYVYTYIWVR